MAISNYSATTVSGDAVAENANRSVLVVTNTGTNSVFLNIDGVAEVNKGIYLAPNGGTWLTDRYLFTRKKVTAITVSGTSNLAIYEL